MCCSYHVWEYSNILCMHIPQNCKRFKKIFWENVSILSWPLDTQTTLQRCPLTHSQGPLQRHSCASTNIYEFVLCQDILLHSCVTWIYYPIYSWGEFWARHYNASLGSLAEQRVPGELEAGSGGRPLTNKSRSLQWGCLVHVTQNPSLLKATELGTPSLHRFSGGSYLGRCVRDGRGGRTWKVQDTLLPEAATM